ncbi:MAG: hypothetical protein ACOCYV_01115 [Planctomycetota bacterium]
MSPTLTPPMTLSLLSVRTRALALLVLLSGTPLALTGAVRLERVGPDTPLTCGLAAWRLRDPAADWLVFDVVATPRLVVTGPDGSERVRHAFLYRPYRARRRQDESPPEFLPTGPRELRIRHRFDLPGEHAWRLVAPDDQELAAGVFQVTPAPVRGVLRVSSANPRLLAEADGTPFIPIGCNVAWGIGANRIDTIRAHLLQLALNGGNHFRLWCASWSCQIESDQPDAYRLDQAWMLDRILDTARHQGVRVTLVLDNHHDVLGGHKHPYGETLEERIATFFAPTPSAQYIRRIRYLMARYAPDPGILAWELFNEIDEVLGPQGEDLVDGEATAAAWAVGAAGVLHAHDPDDHLVTLSLARAPWKQVITAPGLDLIQLHQYVPPPDEIDQHHKDGVDLLLRHRTALEHAGGPYCYSEVGYQGTNAANPGNALDSDGLLLRHQAWAGFLLGGYGSAMNWWWDVYIDAHDLWPLYRPLAAAVKRIDWTDPELAPLRPNAEGAVRVIGWQSPLQALLWPQPRGDTWYNHLVSGHPRPVFADRRPILSLGSFRPETAFQLVGHDMVSGEQRVQRRLRSTATGRLIYRLPADCRDLILTLQAEPPGS